MIKKVLILSAGKGERMMPFTSILSKELLPVNNKATIFHIADELIKLKIKEINIVISKEKMNTYYYFKKYIYQKTKRIKVSYTIQHKINGIAGAIKESMSFIEDDPFLLVLPDNLIKGENVSKKMISLYEKTNKNIISITNISRKKAFLYGIAKLSKGKQEIKSIIEKPKFTIKKTVKALSGRYILDKKFTHFIKKNDFNREWGKEVNITMLLNKMAKNNELLAINSKKMWIDVGLKKSYMQVTSSYFKEKKFLNNENMVLKMVKKYKKKLES